MKSLNGLTLAGKSIFLFSKGGQYDRENDCNKETQRKRQDLRQCLCNGKISQIAKSRELGISDIVREAVREYLAKQETLKAEA